MWSWFFLVTLKNCYSHDFAKLALLISIIKTVKYFHVKIIYPYKYRKASDRYPNVVIKIEPRLLDVYIQPWCRIFSRITRFICVSLWFNEKNGMKWFTISLLKKLIYTEIIIRKQLMRLEFASDRFHTCIAVFYSNKYLRSSYRTLTKRIREAFLRAIRSLIIPDVRSLDALFPRSSLINNSACISPRGILRH